MMEDLNAPENAKENEDYVPKQERVVFENGETERTVEIELLNPPTPEKEAKEAGTDGEQVKEQEEEHEELNLMFKVRIEAPEPASLKMSKKNVCFVTLHQDESGGALD